MILWFSLAVAAILGFAAAGLDDLEYSGIARAVALMFAVLALLVAVGGQPAPAPPDEPPSQGDRR
jgi:hypothetical protein